mgnify:FL=1
MNKVLLCGRLTREPEMRYTESTTIARYTLAVDRKFKKDGEADADFINCVAFGKCAEFAEKYLHKGTKIIVEGRMHTGSYTDNDGNKKYTTDIVVESHEFCESKSNSQSEAPKVCDDGFMQLPDGDEDMLPFN